jgi:CheY-like chemotaxis protein
VSEIIKKAEEEVKDSKNFDLKSILIVDDLTYVVKTIERILQEEGYFTLIAKNGMEALEKYDKYKPDLITIDQNLPDMTGVQLVEKIKNAEENKKTKIIFITAVYDVDTIKSSMRLGIDDYLIKPFQKNKLIETVKKAFDMKNE